MSEDDPSRPLDYHKPQLRRNKWRWRLLIGAPIFGAIHALTFRGVFICCAILGMRQAPRPLFDLLIVLGTPGDFAIRYIHWEWMMFWNAAIWGFSAVGIWYAWDAIRMTSKG